MSMTNGAMPPPSAAPMGMPPPHPMMAPHPAGPPMGGPPGAGAPPQGAPGQPPPQPAPPPPPMVDQFNAPLFMQSVQLLRDERQRGFRIDIETDSTIVPDQAGERKDAMDMVQSIGAFMQSALPMVQAMPAILPLLGKILLFMVRRFPISSELESAFEDAIAKLEQASGQAMLGQGGDQAKTAADQAAAQAKTAADQAAAQAKTAADQAAAQAKIQVAQVQSQTAQLKAQNDLQVEQLRQQTAMQDHQMDMREIQTEAQAQAANDQRDTQRTLLQEQMAQAEHARQMTPPPQPVVPLAPQKLPFMAGPRQ